MRSLVIDQVNRLLNRRARRFFEREEPSLSGWLAAYESNLTTVAHGEFHERMWTKYELLYRYVLKNKPSHILEIGPGPSTLVLIAAMKRAAYPGRLVTLEEHENWAEFLKNAFRHPLYGETFDRQIENTEVLVRPVRDYCLYMYRGVGHEGIPDHPYSFVFVDGPAPRSKTDGQRAFNFDLIAIIAKSECPVDAVIDCRMHTCSVLRDLLGDKVWFNRYRMAGFVRGACSKDLDPSIKGHPLPLRRVYEDRVLNRGLSVQGGTL